MTFSEPMQVTSISAATSGTSCTGTLQVSKDEFATCIAMSGNPVASGGNTAFTLTPSGGLASIGIYKVRVTTAAKDAAGNSLAAQYTATDPFTVRYFHTITIDGNNDFASDESFTSSSGGYTGYLAWDEGYLYVGMSGADVGSSSANKWVALYLGGTPGTNAGFTYNTQQPTVPFAARWHLRWRGSNDLTNTQAWTGSAWADAGWSFAGDVYKTGSFVELRIPLVDIGSPTTLSAHLGMLNDSVGVEATYAAVPSTSHSDGYDPNFGKYLELLIGGSIAPTASPIKP